MSSDERLAVKDVVMDKISGGEENVPPEPERYKCDHCPISFTMLDNLSEHLERKHKIFKTEDDAEVTLQETQDLPVFIDTGTVDIKTEFVTRKQLKKTTPTRKKSQVNLKQKPRVKKTSLGRTENPVLAGPDMEAGDGKICRLCFKVTSLKSFSAD